MKKALSFISSAIIIFSLAYGISLLLPKNPETAPQNPIVIPEDIKQSAKELISFTKSAVSMISKTSTNFLTKDDLIIVENPKSGAAVASPLTIVGRARGTWFFEASFPVEIQDSNGEILGRGIAQAKSDWMTEDFVPFEATVTFVKNKDIKTGVIVLRKDNPSGLPENDDALFVPVAFQ